MSEIHGQPLSSSRMSEFNLTFIEPGAPVDFPPVHQAVGEGILAVGGDLSISRMLSAYESGIFPWFMESEPIVWWAPAERCVLQLDRFKVSKSLRASMRNKLFEIRIDTHFRGVLAGCANRDSTWLTEEVQNAFLELHEFGFAHSFETWQNEELVGGLFGVSIGKNFTGDSMFSAVSDASKVAFAHLVDFAKHHGFGPIDCQIENEHLLSLGAEVLPRSEFMTQLNHWIQLAPSVRGPWTHMRPAHWPLSA